MNIVYTFDNNYTDITLVSLVSLLVSNKEEKTINIFVVDCGIDDSNLLRIKSVCKEYGRSLTLIRALNLRSRIGFNPDSSGWSFVCFVRLFYAELLPSTIEEVIHIDCDTLIRSSLKSVCDIKFNDNYCCACFDCSPKPKKLYGMNNDQNYFSNGFLYINLKKWRIDKITDKFVECIKKKRGVFPHLDQDVLNEVIGKKTIPLPPSYNMMPMTLIYGKKCVDLFKGHPYYSKNDISLAVRNPIMVHFTGSLWTRRPWDQPCFHPYNREWLSIISLSTVFRDTSFIKRKPRKFSTMKSIIMKGWVFWSKVPIIGRILFAIDMKKIYKM